LLLDFLVKVFFEVAQRGGACGVADRHFLVFGVQNQVSVAFDHSVAFESSFLVEFIEAAQELEPVDEPALGQQWPLKSDRTIKMSIHSR